MSSHIIRAASRKISGSDGLLLHYTFEDFQHAIGSNSVTLDIVNGLPAASVDLGADVTLGTEPRRGKSVHFDGGGDSFLRADTAGTALRVQLDTFTVMFHCRIDANLADNFACPLSLVEMSGTTLYRLRSFGFGSDHNYDLEIRFQDYTSGSWTTNFIASGHWQTTLGEWCHVCVTTDSTSNEVELYVNGISTRKFVSPVNIPVFILNHLAIGSNFFDGWGNMAGEIDEVRVYDRILSATEVSEIYRSVV